MHPNFDSDAIFSIASETVASSSVSHEDHEREKGRCDRASSELKGMDGRLAVNITQPKAANVLSLVTVSYTYKKLSLTGGHRHFSLGPNSGPEWFLNRCLFLKKDHFFF